MCACYDNNGVPFKLSLLLSVFGVVGLAKNIQQILKGEYPYFAICYLLSAYRVNFTLSIE